MIKSGTLWRKDALLDRDGLWDRMAVLVSGLCLVHCVSTVMIVALVSSAGGVLLDPVVHEVGLVIAIILGVFALGRGVMEHGKILPAAIGCTGLGMMIGALQLKHDGAFVGGEILFTMIGVCASCPGA